MGKRILWDVLHIVHFQWSLLDKFYPRPCHWLLREKLNKSVLYWRWLVNINMLDWVGWWNHSLHGLI